MSFNTANMIVFVLMVLLPLAAMLALEVFLSRRPSWWPGLVLPCSVTLGAFNMIRLMALNFLLAQPTLGGGILHAGLFTLACLVPSAALFAIYFSTGKRCSRSAQKPKTASPKSKRNPTRGKTPEWDFSCENSAIREGDIVACGERHFLRGNSLVCERHDPRNA